LTRNGVTTVGTAVVAGGVWTVAEGGALAAGTYSYTAIQTDTAGNASGASGALSVTIDTGAAAPALTGISDDNGSSATDETTNDTTITINGTAEASATVTVSETTAGVLGTATADGGGAWSYVYATTLTDATYGFTATQTDIAGTTSVASANLPVVIDTVAPVLPPSLTGITSDSATGGDLVTSDNTLLINGTSELNATVRVTLVGTGVLGTTLADGAGNWSYNHTGTVLADGSHSFTAMQTDLAGNAGTESTAMIVIVDTSANAPAITGITSDNGASASDEVTNDTTLVISGTAEAGAVVALTRVGTGVIGSPTADGSGNWSFDYTGTVLAEAAHSFTAIQTDVAGNVSGASGAFAVTIDITPPAQPTITAPGNDVTTDGTPNFAGTAENNATVDIYSDLGAGDVLIGSTTADGSGDWTDTPPTEIAFGDQIVTVIAVDLAGNESVPSSDLALTVGVPAGTYIIDNDDAEYSDNGVGGGWADSAALGFGNTDSRISSNAVATASWETTDLLDGWYEVSIYKMQASNGPTAMEVDIDHDGGTTNKNLNCATGTSGFVVLGTYHFTGGVATVTISQGATAASMRADSIRFISTAEVIVDNGDADNTENGIGWIDGPNGFQGLPSRRISGAGTDGASADYDADLQNGEEYTVFMYRIAKANAPKMRITIGTGAGDVEKLIVADNDLVSTGWVNLGRFTMGATSTVTIERASNTSTGALTVDAVRWERTGQYSTGPETSGYQELEGVWTDDVGGGYAGEDARRSGTNGSKVRWKTSLMKGTYSVYIWRMQEGAAATIQLSGGSSTITKTVDFSSSSAIEQWVLIGSSSFNKGIGTITMTKTNTGGNPLRASRVVYVPTGLPKELGASLSADAKPALPVGNG
jgi:hypothetical protein